MPRFPRLTALVGALLVVSGASAQIDLNPEFQEAVVQVEASLDGVTVRVNGEDILIAPGTLYVGTGRYVIEGIRPQYETSQTTVDVAAGDTLALRLEMVRSPGTVALSGLPPDAEVFADGEPTVGPSVDLPWGAHFVKVRVPGEPDAMLWVAVEADATTRLTYTREGFDTGLVWGNFGLPGSAQARDGRPVAGALYAGGVVATLVAAVAFEAQRRSRLSDFNAAQADYEAAQSEFQVAAARRAVVEAFEGVGTARRHRTLAVAVGAGLSLVSVADAYLFHTRRPTLDVASPSPSARWEVGVGGAGLAARLSF